jgi:hypothetical protein
LQRVPRKVKPRNTARNYPDFLQDLHLNLRRC